MTSDIGDIDSEEDEKESGRKPQQSMRSGRELMLVRTLSSLLL